MEKNSLKFVYINITHKCNLKCFYCYNENAIREDNDALTLENIKKIATSFKKLGVERVALTGGEPFMNSNWYDFALEFFSKGIEVVFSTNGTLISDEDIVKIKELNAILQISLDGDNDTMEFVSTCKNVKNKVLNVVKKLKSNDILFNLACVVGKHNIDMVDYMLNLSEELEICISFNFYSDIMNNNGKTLALSTDEKYDLIKKIDCYNSNKEEPLITMALPPLLTPDHIPLSVNTGCGLARSVVGILANGDVSICGPASCEKGLLSGNIKDLDFETIWKESQIFNQLRKISANDLEGICASCPYKTLCLGACRLTSYEKYGKMTGPGVLCQEFYERMLENDCIYTEFPSKVMKLEK